MYKCIWEVEILSKERQKEAKYYDCKCYDLRDHRKSANGQFLEAGQSEQSGFIERIFLF